MTFTFCPNCTKKLILYGTGNKVKHFEGKIIKCSKCKSIFIINEKGKLVDPKDMTFRELFKLGFDIKIKFKRK